jgi:hypothetical protein
MDTTINGYWVKSAKGFYVTPGGCSDTLVPRPCSIKNAMERAKLFSEMHPDAPEPQIVPAYRIKEQ